MILIVLTLLKPNMTTVALSRTIVKGEGIKLKKKHFCNKSNIGFKLHYIGYHNKKKSINTHFIIFCRLFSPLGVSLVRPLQ